MLLELEYVMAEKTSGLYKLVTIPAIYQSIQNALGGYEECRDAFFSQMEGRRVLELGCGPGTWCQYLGEYESYLGVDWNNKHIETAQEKYGSQRTSFLASDVSGVSLTGQGRFDFVLAIGLLHHLDDEQAHSMIDSAADLLTEDGVFITLDPVFHNNQRLFSKFMKHLDSGKNIRWPSQYEKLVEAKFSNVRTELRTDLLRIPYSHFMMNCSGINSV